MGKGVGEIGSVTMTDTQRTDISMIRTFPLPRIPSEIDPKIRDYLRALERSVRGILRQFSPEGVKAPLSDKGLVQGCPASVFDDDLLNQGSVMFYFDEVGHTLEVKAKYSDGTVKSGEVANLA